MSNLQRETQTLMRRVESAIKRRKVRRIIREETREEIREAMERAGWIAAESAS